MEVLHIAEILTVLNSPQRFKKDTELQSQIPVHVRVSPIRSSSENRSSSSTTLAILQEVMLGERRPGNRGGATTASGIPGHLAAKTNVARHWRKVILNFPFDRKGIGHKRLATVSDRRCV